MKAKANKLNKPEDGNFGKVWNYICDQHDIKVCFEEGFFNSIGGNLMAGDTIRMLRINNKSQRITEMCEGIVLHVEDTKLGWVVDFFPLKNKILTFGTPKVTEDNKTEHQPDPEFIKGNGKVEWNLGKRGYAVLDDGKQVYFTDNKAEAHAISRGDRPIPVVV
jgi:hypothetical protein